MKKLLVAPNIRIADAFLRDNGLHLRDFKVVIPQPGWVADLRGRRGEVGHYIESPLYRPGFLADLEEYAKVCGIEFRPVIY